MPFSTNILSLRDKYSQQGFTPIAPNIFPEQATNRPDFDTKALSPNNIGAVFDEKRRNEEEKSRDVSTKSPDVGTKSPDVSTKSSDVSTKSPDVRTKSPDVSTKSFNVPTKSALFLSKIAVFSRKVAVISRNVVWPQSYWSEYRPRRALIRESSAFMEDKSRFPEA